MCKLYELCSQKEIHNCSHYFSTYVFGKLIATVPMQFILAYAKFMYICLELNIFYSSMKF